MRGFPFERLLQGSALILTTVASSLTAQTDNPAPAHKLLREQRTISILLNAPADSTFPLFGPAEEAKWAPRWRPQFVYPRDGRQTPEGAVFLTTADTGRETIWIMQTYDPTRREIDYVFVTPGHVTGELHIVVAPDSPGHSRATIVYRYTALSETGSAFVAHWAEEFPKQAPQHWAGAINGYLAAHATHK
jgi:hypothetical protein